MIFLFDLTRSTYAFFFLRTDDTTDTLYINLTRTLKVRIKIKIQRMHEIEDHGMNIIKSSSYRRQ